MFCDRGQNLDLLKTLIRENDNSCSADSCQHGAQPHTACITTNVHRVTDLALILLKVTTAR